MSDALKHEQFQLLYRRCLESVVEAENKNMRDRTQFTWLDTKVSQAWGRVGAAKRNPSNIGRKKK